MPSDKQSPTFTSAWKAVPDWLFRYVLPSRQGKDVVIPIPAHPRFTRMYGVTHSIAFQAILSLLGVGLTALANHGYFDHR